MEDNSTVTEVVETETSGEQTDVVGSEEESYNPFEMVDDSQSDAVDHDEEEAEPVESEKQSRLDNQAARLARLKAERDAKAKHAKETDDLVKNSGAINPYTDKPFESLQEFLDYGKRVRDESGEEAPVAPKEQPRNFFEEDLIDFLDKHPDVDVAALDTNANFRRFCGTRYGKEPLANLYDDYVTLVSTAERTGKAKDTRAERSTGSGQPGGVTLTAAQKKSLEEWNRANPDMKMTAKEYLSR